ncbi:tetratricopeptide repeat protein (macronuclear) [Tetrahymena thermophila SB210]|uniref:Tetratricopeptide repeat protein n=1 Tax=Tetrahymena thermophila (strain SB210) TaxID=312017 RepID=I7MCV1_TETTS|nr:tetratricopeptide repeat protein [Tetrahymena thermophila SB210]EAR84979.1 tetratricopeptide repeat protein [Tetrahymena thermophila SB210]|eukprot:XP_001032642.1 tetratricopeptide repeat protein [Tetrahymena thermophila SB210]
MLNYQVKSSLSQQEEQCALEEILSFLEDQLLQHKGLKTLKSEKLQKCMQFLLFVQENDNNKINYVVKATPIVNQYNRKIESDLINQSKSQVQHLKNLKHPNIAEIHDEFIIDYFHFIVFDQCNSSLSTQAQEYSTSQIGDNQFQELAEQLTDAIDYLHKNSYVLNDISINKIFVGKDNLIKLYDILYFNTLPSPSLNTLPSTTQSVKKVSFDLHLDTDIEDVKVFEEKKKSDIWSIGMILAQYGGCVHEFFEKNSFYTCQKQKTLTPKSPNLSIQANKLIEFILTQSTCQLNFSIQDIKDKIIDFQYSYEQAQLLSTTKRMQTSLMELSSNLQDNGNSTRISLHKFHNTTEDNQLISTDRQLLTSHLERITEFNFLKGKQLLKQYKDFIKYRKDDIDALISLGYLEIKVNCNVQLANKYFEKALKNSANEIDAYFGLCECILAVRDSKNYFKVNQYTQVCLKINSKDWRADYYNAWVNYELQEFDQGEINIDLALQKQKQQGIIYSLKSIIVLKTGENEKRSKALIDYADSLNIKNDPIINLRKGIYYCHFKDYITAQSCFQQSLKMCPNQFQTLIQMIELYNIQNMTEKIQSLVQKVKNLFPQSFIVYQILGDQESNLQQQMSYYQKSIELNPDQTYSYKKIAELNYKLDQYQESIKYYLILIQKNPKDSQSLYACGKISHYQLKNIEQAKEFYSKAIEFDSKNTEILFDLSNIYAQIGQYDKSLELIKNVKELNKNDNRVHKKIAFLSLRNPKYKAKSFIKELKRAISKDPQIEFTLEELQLLNDVGMIKNVEDFLVELIEKNSHKSLIYFLLSQIKIFLNETLNAIELLRNSLQISPLEIKYNILIAKCYNSLNMQEISQFHYKQILQQDQNHLEALFQMSKIKYKEENYEECIKLIKKMENINQEQIEAYYILGDSYLKKKKYDKSIEYFKNYAKKVSEGDLNFQYYKLLANAYQLSGQKKQALENYYSYLKLDPLNIQILFTVSELEQQTNNFQKAKESYECLLKIDPNNHECKLKLGLLLQQIHDYENSYNYLEQYLQIKEDSIEARLAIAQLQAIFKKNNLSAIKQYQIILEKQPENQQALLELSCLFEKNQQFELAEQQISEYIKIYPNDEKGFILKAKLNMRNQKYNEAYLNFQKIISINPQNFMAYTNLGDICKILKKFDESEIYYEKSLEINYRYSISYYEIAHLNFINNQKKINYDKIILYMKSAIQFDPDNIQYFQFLGQVYLNQKILIKKEVIQYFNKCTENCKSQKTQDEINMIVKQLQQIYDQNMKQPSNLLIKFTNASLSIFSQKPSQQHFSLTKLKSEQHINIKADSDENNQQQQKQQQEQLQQQQVIKKRYCNCSIF